MSAPRIEDLYELAPVQQGMLFHTLLEPGSSMYVVQEAYALNRRLDVEALARAWQHLVERHPMLRTSFLWDEVEKPLQVVQRRVQIVLRQMDLRALAPPARRQEIAAFLRRDRDVGFRLDTPPLLRLALLRIGEEEWRFVLTYHHILLDGWSVPLLLAEAVDAYRSFAAGREPELPPSRPYAHFIEWLQQRPAGAAETFWRRELAGFATPTPLAVGQPRRRGPEGGEAEGGAYPVLFAEELAGALRAVARRHGLTVNTVIQGAWAVLLGRYSSALDVLFGATAAGRPGDLAGVEEIVGPFINTVPVRARLKGGRSFVEWLAEHQRRQARARDYGYALLVDIQGWSEVPRGTALFDTLLVFENAPVDAFFRREVREEGRRLEIRTLESFGRLNYPLTVCLEDDGQVLSGNLYFAADRFDLPTLERLAGHLGSLLRSIVEDPSKPTDRLELLPPEERRELLLAAGTPARPAHGPAAIHARFEVQARREPDAIAVVRGEERLSYGGLENRANRLAAYLAGRGAGPEVLVGVLLERGLDLVVALLGILKSGSAYLPLDPLYPPERLAFMLEDSRADLVVTSRRLQDLLPGSGPVPVCLDGIDAPGALAEIPPAAPHGRLVQAATLAYLLYTSGSSGRPKGVALTHGGACALIDWVAETDSEAEVAGVFATTSVCFDCSVFELFGTLGVGGKVILADSVLDLPGLANASEVTLLSSVPSTLADMLEHGDLPDSLRLVHLGGESSPADLAPRLFRLTAVRKVLHLYGPTEDTTYSTAAFISPEDHGPMPIGRPIAGKTALVVGCHGDLLPAGVAGELFLGGVGLARGYWTRPSLTSESFVPDALTGESGARLYRTGDLVRRLADGRLEFLGRVDHQVKIRGLRVELGEIEAALEDYPGIQQAVVVLREDVPGMLRLVSYFVGDAAPEPAELRRFLRDRLPDPMVPNVFLKLEILPWLPNRKLDRSALPAPEPEAAAVAAVEPPVTLTEELVAGLWASVLDVEPVGVTQDFFELGGHSLLAMQLVARVRQAFAIELPLRSLLESPTVRGLSREIDGWLGSRGGRAALPPLEPVPLQATFPLSFAQERLWFLHQMSPEAPSYNCPLAIRLPYPAPPRRVAAVLASLVARHEVLRTRYPAVEGRPVQVVSAAGGLRCPVVDLMGLGKGDADREAARLTRREAARPFDLAAGPVFRPTLLRVACEEQVVVLAIHHIAADGWSVGILATELARLWSAEQGDQDALAPLPIQFRDFAVWQRSWLQGEVLETQLSFWREALAGAPTVLELPTDRPRPRHPSYGGDDLPFALGSEVSRRLERLSRRLGSTLFMTLLAGFSLLLYRLTGQRDLLVGSPIANRPRRELEGLIGFFVNTLVFRLRVDGGQTFEGLIGEVRRVALAAYSHQELPFEKLVEELRLAPDPSRQPLFQVSFTHQAAARLEGAAAFPGEFLSVDAGTAHFDLTVATAVLDSQVAGTAQFSSDLFDRATVSRWLAALEVIYEAMEGQPQAPCSSLVLLREAEREELLRLGSGQRSPLPPAGLDQLFLARVSASTERVAVVEGDEHVTYGELARRARWLRGELLAGGLEPEQPVGLLADNGAALATGALAVVAAGGAYLPLDPAFPSARIERLMEDAGARLLLVSPRHEATTAGFLGRRLVLGDVADAGLENAGGSAATTHSARLAYVVYTSGSTGEPKGVAVTHEAVIRLVVGADYLPFEKPRRFAWLANPAFDASTFELWGALLHGSTLVALARDEVLSPPALAGALARYRITSAFLTTALFNQVAVEVPVAFSVLEDLLFGGETVSVRAVDAVLAAGGPKRLLHVYGPTEATTFAAWHEVEGVPAEASTVPIGRPLANTTLRVLDAQGHLALCGVPGELHIGGPGLARGYLRRPGSTAERFVPDAAGLEGPGGRAYRTGDLARWRADGTLEFVRRADRQVKLRGFRIEPAEIEAAMASHPAIAQAAVFVDSGAAERLLVGVYQVRSTAVCGTGELRRYLRALLPEYMVPARLAALDSLPLGTSGKVDRKALAALVTQPEEPTTSGPPAGPVEEALAAVFEELLGIERASHDSDFFALGGHSLLAAQTAARVRKVLGVDLPLRAVFDHPRLRDLAQEVTGLLRARRGLRTAPILPVPRDQMLPMSYGQQRLWFISRLQPASPVYNIPSPLRLRGRVRLDALVGAVREIVRRHEVLRTTFPVDDGIAQQVIGPASGWRPGLVDLRDLGEEEAAVVAARLAVADAVRPFDLARQPAFRASVVLAAREETALLVNFHHAVADGWSIQVFLEELAALYAAYASGVPSPLPELPVQYADFAFWQRQWLEGGELESQLEYWRAQLAGLPPLLELPTDYPRPPVQSFRGETCSLALPPATVELLRGLTRMRGVTLFTVFLAAFEALLARYSGQSDIAVATTLAGRSWTDVEPLIGLFVNTVVLRGDLRGRPSFDELLARLRPVVLDAFTYQDVPFERLVEELQEERSLSYNPLAQTILVFLNRQPNPVERDATEGLEVEALACSTGTAKFDLSLFVAEDSEEILLSLEYGSDLFEPVTAERLLRHLAALLAAASEEPEARIEDLPLISQQEEAELLASSREPPLAGEQPALLHQLFEAQAKRTPAAIAVSFEDEEITYRELDQEADVLAAVLADLGAGPESRVGLLLERSPLLVTGLLGILKCGAAYVPLDPGHPRERHQKILTQAGIEIVVCDELTRPRLHGLPVRALPVEDIGGHGPPVEPPRLDRRNLAYVLFTSGSTGSPKGVAVQHGSAAALIHWGCRLYTEDQTAVTLGSTALSFDVSVFEIFAPLSRGGRLHLVPDALHLPRLLGSRGITLLNAAPSVMAEILRSRELPPTLRVVNLGGEPLHRGLADAVLERAPQALVRNLYGPTEATVYATFLEVEAGQRTVTIGRPLAGVGAYLVGSGHLQPTGVPGELYLGGFGLARGYLADPRQTAERFVPDGFSGQPGARLYRTGDRVRRAWSGEIEFLGRMDNQVKLRGFRIELGEVEWVLQQHGSILDAAVRIWDLGGGDQRLVAYLVPARPSEGVPADLRTYLEEKLPGYMVPGSLVQIESLPRTTSGKLDRGALPPPGELQAAREVGYVAPRDELELAVAKIWGELLGVERVGAKDNFFELGGHSLLAESALIRLAQQVGRRVALATFFQHPTVEELASHLRRETPAASGGSPLVLLRDGPARSPILLVHSASGSLFSYLGLVGRLPQGRRVVGFQAEGLYRDDSGASTVEALAESYLDLLIQTEPRGPYSLAGWSFGGLVAYEMARRLWDRGLEVDRLVLIDSWAPDPAVSEEELDRRTLLDAFVFDLGLASSPAAEEEAPEAVADPDPLAWILDQAKAAQVLPRDFESERFRRRFAVFEALLRAGRRYRPEPYGGTATVIIASESLYHREPRPLLGWGDLVCGGLEAVTVEGNHYTLLREPAVKRIAEEIERPVGVERRD